MRIHNGPSDEPGAAKPQVGALIPRWGFASVCLALGLAITDAPSWAWVLALAMWMAVWAVARVLVGMQAHLAATVAQASASPPTDVRPQEAMPLQPAAESAEGHAHDGLEALVSAADATAGPDPAREAEQEALRYALSHDLRAPLRVIDGFTRIVQEDYGRHLDKLGQDHLERVLAASARMNGMIDAILAQAQLATEPLGREDIDLSALVRDVAQEQSVTRRMAAPVEWVIQPGLCAQADLTLVRRVVENLVGNALKYSAKVPSPRIEFGCMPATNPPVYFVRDNGAGFDMQHADKLFGMFQRLHSAKDFEGTGVGLAGVRQIIRRHGGRVWAEAQSGQGACFYFTLTDRLDSTSQSLC